MSGEGVVFAQLLLLNYLVCSCIYSKILDLSCSHQCWGPRIMHYTTTSHQDFRHVLPSSWETKIQELLTSL